VYIEPLIALSILLITANNMGIVKDYLKLSGVVPRKYAGHMVIIPVMTGLLLEGSKLTVYSDKLGLNEETRVILILILTSTFALGTLLRIPTSATLVTVGATIGIVAYYSLPIDIQYITNIFIGWVLGGTGSIILTYIIYRFSTRIPGDIAKKTAVIPTFLVGYVFGANTLGLIAYLDKEIVATDLLIYIAAIALGVWIPIGRVGEEVSKLLYGYTIKTYLSILAGTSIIIEAAHNAAIPMPLSSLLTLASLGPILGRETIMVNTSHITKSIFFWILTVIATPILVYIGLATLNLIISS